MSTEEAPTEVPIQPVENPILCSPYEEPSQYWKYDRDSGQPMLVSGRREAGYWYKTEKTGTRQQKLLTEEERDDLPLVNRLRADVKRWREVGYRGASSVTRGLLEHWARSDLERRLFFCQREAVETLIYLAEIRMAGKTSRTKFQNFELSDEDLGRLLKGQRPSFAERGDFQQTLVDKPFNDDLLPLNRLGCKMATGSGKTVVMAMLIAWAFCNRGRNPMSSEFPRAVLVCCPNLTVKERLQVLRPDYPGNYFDEFNIVPEKYRPLMHVGKVLVTNWHAFAPESEHREGEQSYAVVDKGPETSEAFAKRVLGELADRMPIMVLNDEGHHCWRPAPTEEQLSREETKDVEAEKEEATIWIQGLDRLNNCRSDNKPGIRFCVDLSATPFYIKGSGYPEGRPFPWLVSDFGLVDAIESGIVKIPRLPVSDTTGRPEPKYFGLWHWMKDELEPAEFLPGKAGKPKPEAVWREAQPALQQLAGQWVERFKYLQNGKPGQEQIPPVLIIVCDNTELAELFFRKISGEHEEEIPTEAEVAEVKDAENGAGNSGQKKGRNKAKKQTVYSKGDIYPEYFSNSQNEKRTIRIDTKLLAEAESENPQSSKQKAAEELRQVVATVGKPGQPGEQVRCVVSVSMLTEGWDAQNVTNILGVRAFGSQLLCEQVVGRGLRRIDYRPYTDEKTGKHFLHPEYVDVYGIPFSVIPFKGRATKQSAPEDQPKQHVKALPEREHMEMRFPVVEGYAFALRKSLIHCDIEDTERLVLEPNREPTATFVNPTAGYQEGAPSGTGAFVEQNRKEFYRSTHLQQIKFEVTRLIVNRLTGNHNGKLDAKQRVFRLQSRHQLFPQVYFYVDQYVRQKVDFQDEHSCELGLQKYVDRMVDRLSDAIEPDASEEEPPLIPVLNRYKPVGTTAEVDFKTTRSCHETRKSHIDQVVLDTETWESSAAFRLESCNAVEFYARNDHLGLVIPYEYQGIEHSYEPDFLVRLRDGSTVLLEIKGFMDDRTRAKHQAAKRWRSAVNNWGQLGQWEFHVNRNAQTLERELAHFLERVRETSAT